MAPVTASRKADSQTTTLRNPPHTYFHLRVRSLPPQSLLSLDEVTIRSYLTAALQQYLGLTGTAIPIDILKVDRTDAWVRVPHADESAVTAAVSQWVGAKGMSLRVMGRGSWLGGLVGRGTVEKERFWSLEET
jgi:ribonuclease P/MRP protein subunit POP8